MRRASITGMALLVLLWGGSPVAQGRTPNRRCTGGEASDVSVKGSGAPGTLGTSLCASGSVDVIYVDINMGSMKRLQIAGPNLETLGSEASCAKALNVVLYDHPSNYLEYNPTSDWHGNWNLSPEASCTLTVGRTGDRLSGKFTGHLMRFKADGKKEFLDISLTYSIIAPPRQDEQE